MAKRVYEVMYIAQPEATSEDIAKLNEGVQSVVESEGGSIVRTDDIGKRRLAYEIKRKKDGYYVLFEIEDSGKAIAEIERRFRVNDAVIRFITVRVDEARKAADKISDKRARRKNRRSAQNGDQASTDLGEVQPQGE